MTNCRHILTALLLLVSLSQTATAQTSDFQPLKADSVRSLNHYRLADNWFVGIHAGVSGPMSENIRPRDYFRLGSQHPAFGISVGKFFSPAIGFRVTANLMQQTAKAEREAIEAHPDVFGKGYYSFKHFNGYVDVLFNLSNIVYEYSEQRRFNVLGVFGMGMTNTYGFDKQKAQAMAAVPTGWYNVDTKSRSFFSLQTGLMLSYQLNECWDLDLEANINVTDDALDGVRYDDKYDGYLSAMLGLKYHFPDHLGHRRFRYTTVSDLPDVTALNEQLNEERRRLEDLERQHRNVYRQRRLLDMTVSFIIDKFNITDIQRRNVEAVANYMKEHPDMDVIICGFADVQTAYPPYNMRLSKRRVTAVFNMLVHQFGVDPNRLRVDYKGDIVQPYDLKNEWNRVVVFVLEPHKDYITE